MRVWVDITNSPQVPFFRPLVALLAARGHEVRVSARAFAQTVELLERSGLPYDIVGPPHGGAGRIGKARAMAARVPALRRFARGQAFDLALSHASHELPLVARSLSIRSAYAYDYELARLQHTIGSRAATRVVVPEAIPQERLDRLGATCAKTRRYPGLKEEYYLSGLVPDPAVLEELGLDAARVLAVVRTPPEVSLYHRHGNALFSQVLDRLGRDPAVQAVVLPRTPEQGEAIRAARLPSLVLPRRAVDAQSLVALSDLVVSAGGTMNREAVALGVPVYTTFAGRRGALDDALIHEGRLRHLLGAEEIEVVKRPGGGERRERDPRLLLDLLLGALEA